MMTNKAKSRTPTRDDAQLAKEASRKITKLMTGEGPVQIQISRNGISVDLTLPESAIGLLSEALVSLGDGRPVTVISQETELGTIDAAKYLGISRTFLTKLIDEGKIDCRYVGSHRRILFSEIQRFKESDDNERRAKLRELNSLTEDMGLM